MLSIKPLGVPSPPRKIFAFNNHEIVVQDYLVKSLKEKQKELFFTLFFHTVADDH